MSRFLLRRFLGMLGVLWAVVTLTFFMIRLIPGDPIRNALGINAAQSVVEAKRLLDAGTSDKEKVEIAISNLSKWYFDAKPKVEALVLAVKEK